MYTYVDKILCCNRVNHIHKSHFHMQHRHGILPHANKNLGGMESLQVKVQVLMSYDHEMVELLLGVQPLLSLDRFVLIT